MATRRKPPTPVLACGFYQTDAGNEPVRNWLKALPEETKKAIGADINLVQWEWPVGKPLIGSLTGGLYEVRTTVDSNAYRVLFCIVEGTMVLLHGFQKKTQKTPKADLDLARRRMKS